MASSSLYSCELTVRRVDERNAALDPFTTCMRPNPSKLLVVETLHGRLVRKSYQASGSASLRTGIKKHSCVVMEVTPSNSLSTRTPSHLTLDTWPTLARETVPWWFECRRGWTNGCVRSTNPSCRPCIGETLPWSNLEP